eukprot:10776800-Prorocentrum_lima.AAC.1
MTSSLVGSEMCIRDRVPECVPDKKTSATRMRALRGHSVGKASLSKDPVSYTHLTLPTICSV